MPYTISFEEAAKFAPQVRTLLNQYPMVTVVGSELGRPDDGTDPTGFFNCEFYVGLKPYDDTSWKRGKIRSKEELIADVQKKLAMKEGFDVGLEMSGSATAFREMLANMCHGGKIAILGIPEKEMAIDWNLVVFNMLTIKGIYGREMYETWYMMTVMLQSGLDIRPVITHRYHCTEFQKAFEQMLTGQSGKIILRWS